MSYEEKIKELKINLPDAKAPVGNYVATKVSGKMLFVSGQISIDETGQLIKGKVGKDLDTEAGFDTSSTADDILDFTERNPFGEVDF